MPSPKPTTPERGRVNPGVRRVAEKVAERTPAHPQGLAHFLISIDTHQNGIGSLWLWRACVWLFCGLEFCGSFHPPPRLP